MNKLTITELISFKVRHPKCTQIDVARRYGVTQQYVSELWNKYKPTTKFNSEWGIKILCTCKTCGKHFYRYRSEVNRGNGVYCCLKCKYS